MSGPISEQAWGLTPDTFLVGLTAGLLLTVLVGIWQLLSAERARKADVFFRLLSNYDEAETYDGIKLLSSRPYQSLTEFNEAFEHEIEPANIARRRLKILLAPYGYLLRFKLAKPKDIFPILPAAIGLWGKGLKEVEHELLATLNRRREHELGYDLVALVDYLYEQYDEEVQACIPHEMCKPINPDST